MASEIRGKIQKKNKKERFVRFTQFLRLLSSSKFPHFPDVLALYSFLSDKSFVDVEYFFDFFTFNRQTLFFRVSPPSSSCSLSIRLQKTSTSENILQSSDLGCVQGSKETQIPGKERNLGRWRRGIEEIEEKIEKPIEKKSLPPKSEEINEEK
jgi:hypothetical protein